MRELITRTLILCGGGLRVLNLGLFCERTNHRTLILREGGLRVLTLGLFF